MFLEACAFFVFGLLWGSFANVVIYRWPKGESFIFGRSHCQNCQKKIPWYENVPVFSYLWLRRRCSGCSAIISFRYPLVELITGFLFAAVYLKFGWSFTTLEALIFVFGLVVVSFIDLDHMLLPDIFTLSGIVIGLAGAALNPERSLVDSVMGVLIGGGILWSVAVLYFYLRKEEGLGGGDIKLLAWIGAVLGLKSVPVVVLFASLWGSFFGILFALTQRTGMKSAIPFGPYLALGALFYLFYGDAALDWYFRTLLPQ